MPLKQKRFAQLSKKRLQEILNNFKAVKIAVIGDFCLDVYWILDMRASELSVETNKMTQPVKEQRYSLGGAGNVVANLKDMGVREIDAFGVIGDDPFGKKMFSLLSEIAKTDNMLISKTEAWQTLAYCKPYVDEEELPRIDMGNFNALPNVMADDLLCRFEKKMRQFNVVIINQQVISGIHTKYCQQKLAKLVKENSDLIFIYDGRHVQNKYNDAWLKINDREALKMCGRPVGGQEPIGRNEAMDAAASVYSQLNNKPVIVTRGAKGCIICQNEQIIEIPGIKVTGKIDTVGAGDSLLAGMAAALATGADLVEAAQIGNLVASVTIKKIGRTGTANAKEILKAGASPRYVS